MRSEGQQKFKTIRRASAAFRAIAKALMVLTAFLGLGSVVSVTFGIAGINYG